MTHILYIDDDLDSIMLVKKILDLRGYEIRWGFNGKEGLDLAMSHPGVILLDIRLPDMSGYEVARQLRSSGRRQLASVPIIAITAYDSLGEEEKALEAGCDLYMNKPIDMRVLSRHIEAFLSASPSEISKEG